MKIQSYLYFIGLRLTYLKNIYFWSNHPNINYKPLIIYIKIHYRSHSLIDKVKESLFPIIGFGSTFPIISNNISKIIFTLYGLVTYKAILKNKY
jgi:hypothetical protein